MSTRPASNWAQIVLAICAGITVTILLFNTFKVPTETYEENSNIFETSGNKIELIRTSISEENVSLFTSRRRLITETYNHVSEPAKMVVKNCSYNALRGGDVLTMNAVFLLQLKDLKEVDKLFVWLIKNNDRVVDSYIIENFNMGENTLVIRGGNYSNGQEYQVEIGYTTFVDNNRTYIRDVCDLIIDESR